jgi:hypothetical protein
MERRFRESIDDAFAGRGDDVWLVYGSASPLTWPAKRGAPVPDALCALGTTIKTAGSREAFRRVDFGHVVAFARAVRAAGVLRLMFVSAIGAAAMIAAAGHGVHRPMYPYLCRYDGTRGDRTMRQGLSPRERHVRCRIVGGGPAAGTNCPG